MAPESSSAPSPSFFKELMRSIFLSFFRIIAIGFAIIVLIGVFSLLVKNPPTSEHVTVAHVLPNHEWKQEALSKTAPTIVKINITGELGIDQSMTAKIRKQLIDTINGEIKKEQVKGLLLCMDTPGGTVTDSDGVYRLLLEYKKQFKIPVYAFADGICASGGMYIACAADKIYATDATLIGSIGVLLGPAFNVSQLMTNVGIQSKTITAGKGKDDMNPFRPWQPGEEATFQAITTTFYHQFLDIVLQGRPKLTKEILIEQGARIYDAHTAEQLGFIDRRLNTLEEVLKQVSTELGIEKEYQVVELQSKNWLDELFEGNHHVLFPNKIEHTLSLPGVFHPKFSGKFLYLYCPEYHPG